MPCRVRLVAALFLSAVWPTAAFAQLFPVTISQNFTGSTFLTDSSFRTPDTMGAAGIDHFVELINGRFSVYRKSDGLRVHTRTLNQFWNDAGQTPSGINGAFDPRVVYDPHARRWYAVAVDNGNNANNFLFAVSSASDPTRPWTAFKIDSDTDDSNWADFPMIGYNPEAVYVSANMPSLTAGQTRMAFVVLGKADLLQPTPSIANMTLLEDVLRPPGTNALSPQLTVDASNLIGLNVSMPILMHDFAAGGVYRAEIFSAGSPSVTNIGPVGVPPAANPPTVDQPGPKQNLEANDGRFQANTVLHNGQIYAVHSVADMGLAALRFLRVDAVTNSVLESSIIVDPGGRALTFPSIAVNEFDDVVIGVTGTSTTEFASSYALVGKTVGGITSFDQPKLLQAGVSDYERLDSLNRNRWGDYSATTVDPADPAIFWTTQEFVSSTDHWSTQVTELVVLQPDEARWADPIDGNFDDAAMWQTTHGAAPKQIDSVIFSRPTDPGGSFTVNFPPPPAGAYVHESASIRQGNVVLDLGGNHLDLARQLEVGPYYGHPQATVANGSISSVAGFIANRPTSEGHLTLDNAQWSVTADLIIGSLPTPSAGCCLPGATGGIGTLTIDNGSQLHVGSTLTIWGFAAVNLIDGLLTAPTIQQNAPVGGGLGLNFVGGALEVDTFNGDLLNIGGVLAPGGNAIGTTDAFSYFQRSGASFAIDIGGAASGQFDQLNVAGTAEFDGALDITLLGGFVPGLSDVFEILIAGTISPVSLPNLLANTVFPSLGTNWLDWQLFQGVNAAGFSALTLAIMPALTGDFNADGTVDARDYIVWRKMNGQSGVGLAADSNLDSMVDLVDYLAWRGNFGQSIPGPGSGAGTVPEPASAVLMMLAAIVAGTFRRYCVAQLGYPVSRRESC